MARRAPPTADRSAPTPAADAAAVDALYGLEPVIEPGAGGAGLGEFVSVGCPYCGEFYGTPVDLSAGSFSYIEDCQVCCQPIELSGSVDADGALAGFRARRLD